jgi:predicted DNA-binding transcriptional regulator
MENAKKILKTIRYLDKSTGEYREYNYITEPIFDEEEGYLFKPKTNSLREFLDRPLPPCLSWSEQGRVNKLKYYMLSDNQFLVHKSNNTLKPITIREICKILNMSDRQAKALVKKIKIIGILKEVIIDGITYFAFNPVYACKSKRITLTMFLLFQKELMQILPQWVIGKFLSQANELKPDIKILK